MGISWIMEAITYLATDANNKDLNFFVIIIDVWNFLQGLVVFILFVIKRRVLNLIKKRFVKYEINDHKMLFIATNLHLFHKKFKSFRDICHCSFILNLDTEICVAKMGN